MNTYKLWAGRPFLKMVQVVIYLLPASARDLNRCNTRLSPFKLQRYTNLTAKKVHLIIIDVQTYLCKKNDPRSVLYNFIIPKH